MSVPFIDLTREYSVIKDELQAAVTKVFESGRYILGPEVKSFEEKVAASTGTKYAVGVSCGTEALHLALRSLGVKEGDEVIVPPFTFIATSEIIAYLNAIPVYADIDPETFNLDPEKIKEKITKKTKVIIPVHLFGQSADMKPILEIAKENNLKVIEDCAQSMGATYENQMSGSMGDMGCFSFFPTKNLGGYGDGGAITTSDEALYEKLLMLRMHGSKKTYLHEIIGYACRLDELQAALLNVKMKYLEERIAKRRENAAFYNQQFADIEEIITPVEKPYGKHTYNQYTIKIKNRNQVKERLAAEGIASMIYYPIPHHLQAAFTYLGHQKGDFPVSERVEEEVLSLPIFPELTKEESLKVIEGVKKCL